MSAGPFFVVGNAWRTTQRRGAEAQRRGKERVEGTSEAVDDSFDAVAHDGHVEVQEKTKPTVAELKMCEELSVVDWEQLRDCLELHDDGLVDEDIDSISWFQSDVLVHDRELDLASNDEAAVAKFVGQASLVRAFQKPWAQSPVNLDRRINNYSAQLVQPSLVRILHEPLRLCALRASALSSSPRVPIEWPALARNAQSPDFHPYRFPHTFLSP